MAEPITVDNGSGTDYAVLVDDVTDGTLGTGAKQLVGLTDATIGSTTKVAAGGGVEANALRVTIASDSTGVVSVDDNGTTLSVDDGAGSLTVDDGAGSLTVDNAGTFAVQVDGAALTALQLLDDTVFAEDAQHSTGDKGIQIVAVRTDTATARAGTDGDYIPLIVDSSGRLHVNAGSVPAAARTTDSVSTALAVDRLMNNLTAVTPVSVIIDNATSGDNTIVAAQGASNIILVHQVLLVASAAVTVRFESGAGGTALTGQMQIAANQGFVLPFSPVGWFKTAANTLLNLELSGATSVDGVLVYSVVT